MDFNRNNLDKSTSPYLKQHKDNPILWQEWSLEAIEYAKKHNKILFVSVGYATCHWCHVMASEAFSSQKIADYLKEHFVSIKVDKEQRPDIDSYLMNFIISLTGQGGWPLNGFLTPHLKPIYALTYAPLENKQGMPPFMEILEAIKKSSEDGKFNEFENKIPDAGFVKTEKLIDILSYSYDDEYNGFGMGQKFPPHSTLIFMLHYLEETGSGEIRSMLNSTLDTMARSGLSDHLQGGFFRYCVDRTWTIPHFEKMLYDQAMLLWTYSLAYKLFGFSEYKIVCENLIKCLEETYEDDGLFYSAHDADTNHVEGDTYLWTPQDLELSDSEQKIFKQNYYFNDHGNYEGKNHLIKKELKFSDDLTKIEEKLLGIRKKREQPFIDKKLVTSWNSLIGIALVNAYRYLGDKKYLDKAKLLFDKLIKKHFNSILGHSSLDGKLQRQEFLEDYASILLFISYLHEETGEYEKELREFENRVKNFKKKEWLESNNPDFKEIFADRFDHPTPSSISLAELALTRSNILIGQEYIDFRDFAEPLNYDFLNVNRMVQNGLFHVLKSPDKKDWSKLGINYIQVKGDKAQDCYKGTCKEL